MKKGPQGHFPKRIYEALKGAFVTYVKLEQAACQKQSTTKQLSHLVNGVANTGGLNKRGDDLTRKLKRDTAHHFKVGKANVQEHRRVQWTTEYNLSVWYDTWKSVLIDLGFATPSTQKN
jgi:hypothetical protein